MLFNSYIFILLFLPICILGYFGLNYFKKYNLAQFFLLVMSLWFYGYFNKKYLAIILISIVINYTIYLVLRKMSKKRNRKVVLLLGIIINLSALGYFKYMDFFITNINSIFNTNYALKNILLPLGISFFTFQQISFIIDTYHKEVPKYNFLNYACFVTFFPQLIAGPIVTHDELVPQFIDKGKKKIDFNNFAKGIYIFTLGLSKKVLLADTLGNVVDFGYKNISTLNTTNAIIVMLAYTFQIYFDFSGYCDMAIGIAKIMNIDLPLNFNSPYKAFNITEFWKRWHITLTRFLTKYVYIPLGGNKKGRIRTYINIMIVFLISGLWHGANWNFVFWGACHGMFSIITRHFKNFFEKIHPTLNWIITFSFINVTWIFFRADTFTNAIIFLKRIMILDFGRISEDILECFRLSEIKNFLVKLPIEKVCLHIVLIVFFLVVIMMVLRSKNAYEKMEDFKPSTYKLYITLLLLIWCIFSFSGVSTFLYFNF